MAIGTGDKQRFYQVLSAAIDDLLEHGFDSQERLDRWLVQLQSAARNALIPQSVLVQKLQESLGQIFERTTKESKLLKANPGVSRFTLQNIKPKLHAELNRRIVASASLIKLNRDAMISKTLQRFAGWASSVPSGGTEIKQRSEVKDNVRRGISGLSFEERRVMIDQGHKLVASINDIVACDGGAIAAEWRHIKLFRGQKYYKPRPEHVARDGKIFLIRDSWADKDGLVKLAGHQYTDQIEMVGELVFCFPGDSKIPFADGVRKAYRRWYSGQLTEFVTASGKSLRATPNHPVLTVDGWVRAGDINVGDNVIEVADQDIESQPKSNNDHAITTIAQIFSAVEESGVFQRVAGSSQQFHGDGADGDVDIVNSASPLTFDSISTRYKFRAKLGLSSADHFRFGFGAFEFFLDRCFGAASSFVGSMRIGFVLFLGLILRENSSSFFNSPDRSIYFQNAVHDDRTASIEFLGKLQDTNAAVVKLAERGPTKNFGAFLWGSRPSIDTQRVNSLPQSIGLEAEDWRNLCNGFPFRTQAVKVIDVKRTAYAGHVYNLQTAKGCYITDGIVTHNCSCSYRYIYSLRDLPSDMLTRKGEEWLAEAKRRVRAIA